MTEQYTQTVEVTISKSTKINQLLGILFLLISLIFVLISVFINWFFMFGFATFLVLGIVMLQIYNSAVTEYWYTYSPKHLIIAKTNIVNGQNRVATILFNDVIRFALFADLKQDKDIIACNNITDSGVYCLEYRKDDSNVCRLLFQPDDYMLALLQERLTNISQLKK